MVIIVIQKQHYNTCTMYMYMYVYLQEHTFEAYMYIHCAHCTWYIKIVDNYMHIVHVHVHVH